MWTLKWPLKKNTVQIFKKRVICKFYDSMAPIMPNWFSITTIIIYRKTQRIKKNSSN